MSSSVPPTDQLIGTKLLASAIRAHQRLSHDAACPNSGQIGLDTDVGELLGDGDCALENKGDIISTKANDDLLMERNVGDDITTKEIGRTKLPRAMESLMKAQSTVQLVRQRRFAD